MGDYDVRWVIFHLDNTSGEYINPRLDGSLPQGAGFWMIQNTGNTISLKLPESIESALTENSSTCAVDSCTSSDLAVRNNQASYSMIGSVLTSTVAVDQLRLRTESTSRFCQSGCDLDQAANFEYLSAPLWRWDTASGLSTR